MIAALFVDPTGPYVGRSDVDPWHLPRDARTYAGPWPVVAHPPCERWGNFWWSARHKGKGLGDDDGCFAAALDAVRRWGGVLEHPAGSRAWAHFGLQRPPRSGGWVQADVVGWTCHVEQRHYGHRARKATWLYYVGSAPPRSTSRTSQPPRALVWGPGPAPEAWVSADRPMAKSKAMGVELMGKRERRLTPPAFAEVLLSLARGAR